ncbi:MAG: hypothetical protein ACT4QB_21960 [Gammaproteobacteria bacterium]
MAVKWEELKAASTLMVKNAAQAVTDTAELQATVTEAAAKASGTDKTAWEGAGTELATLLAEAKKAEAASKELDTIADGKKDEKAGDAETQRQIAQTAAETAIGISQSVLIKLEGITGAADAREDLEALATPLKVVKTQAETKAKPALGEASPTPTPPAAVTPGTTSTTTTTTGKTAAEKAVAAATEAETAATTADTEAKNIDKATDVGAAKAVATKVVTAATAAKTKAGEAATEATKAKTEATGTAKTAWEEAVGAANAAKTAAQTAETEATGVATAADLAAAKAAATKVVTAATAAKEKASIAKGKVDAAKSPGTAKTPEKTAEKGVDKEETKEKKKTPGAFGMSVTAAYSKKFSLETKMHSEIKVTMVPYPPPALFLDWIRDHFEEEKKKRE